VLNSSTNDIKLITERQKSDLTFMRSALKSIFDLTRNLNCALIDVLHLFYCVVLFSDLRTEYIAFVIYVRRFICDVLFSFTNQGRSR